MTPRERVLQFLDGNKVDRLPNFSIVMQIIGRYSEIGYDECVQDYRKFCEANYNFCKDHSIDLLCAISDPVRETSAYGSSISFPKDGVPHAKEHLLKEFEDWKTLSHFNSLEKERTLDRINAVRYFKENYPDYPVCGWVEGAFAECCDLRDINNFMVDIMVEDPSGVHAFLSFVCDQHIEFALKQIEAGADIIGIGDAATSLISTDSYKEFALPYQKKLIDAIHTAGGKTKLHICGDTTRHLSMILQTETDILDIDSLVDMRKAYTVFKDSKTILCGNLNPTQVMLEGSVENVKESVNECFVATNGHFLVAPGCEVPRNTPYENLHALHDAIVALVK